MGEFTVFLAFPQTCPPYNPDRPSHYDNLPANNPQVMITSQRSGTESAYLRVDNRITTGDFACGTAGKNKKSRGKPLLFSYVRAKGLEPPRR